MTTNADATSWDGHGNTVPEGRLTATAENEGIDAAVAAARRVISALLHAGGNTAAEMADVADRLNAVADHLDGHAPSREDRMVDMWSGEGVTRHDPVTGPENAIAPPLTLTGNPDGSVSGTTTLGMAYQGPPGYAHGGVSALLLDHSLGVANHWAGTSGMTARLTLHYHRPTPLFEELTVRARCTAVDGRKIHTEGTISAGDTTHVTAEGLFIRKFVPLPS
ncbi:PaaI family thioesterase [Saccharomonospora iraqiensis]|uniref:PaaI family thioesterase n=1 Tax=Saccharomonospora iraqiensis TaxID=52698 RepID=UPI00022E463A|nr:hotdog domain-containing protein [Saccharomonospora iraqiensis]